MIGDRVILRDGAKGVVRDEQNGRSFVKIDGSGNTGWFETAALVPEAAKTWPPQVEVKGLTPGG